MTTSRNEGTPNRDPITGAPGAHPVGTGLGAAAGGMAAGAAAGTVAGPVGTVIGAAVGAVVGGLAGKGIAESIDPTMEEAYWREEYVNRPYVTKGANFDDYGPAYRYGVEGYLGKHIPARKAFSLTPFRHFTDLYAYAITRAECRKWRRDLLARR